MQRRIFLGGLAAMTATLVLSRVTNSLAGSAVNVDIEALQSNWRDLLSCSLL